MKAETGGGRNWGDVSKERWAGQPPPEAGRDKDGFHLEPPERVWLRQCFDFGLQVSRIMRGYISVVVSHTVCGSLSQQPQKANTVGERS